MFDDAIRGGLVSVGRYGKCSEKKAQFLVTYFSSVKIMTMIV